jgi:hypothetical protein
VSPLTKPDRAHPAFVVNVLDLTLLPLIEATTPKRNFKKCDYGVINEAFRRMNWQSILESCAVENAIEAFYDIINNTIEQHVPFKKMQGKHKYPVWYSRALIKIIKEKYKAHKRWKKFGNLLDYDEFSFLRRRQQHVQEECFAKYTNLAEKSIAQNPKAIWTYIKSIRGGSGYPKMLTYGDMKVTDGVEICNAFNGFFKSVFGVPSQNKVDTNCYSISNDDISKITVSVFTVEKQLKLLDPYKGAGCDGIPPVFWRNCAETLSLPLALVFNISLNNGVFPNIWKKAHIVPIHKKGTKSKIENYRGISILNTVGKVFEKIVFDAIYPVICKELPDNQHGFLKRRSTITNLTCFSNYILHNMEEGGQIDVIYTDFEKAFDRVDHDIIIHKLYGMGIHGDLLRWIKSYLFNRSQAVVIGGYKSDFVNIPTGLPQGSHLGALFYNVYVADIISCFTSARHLMYADDKKIFMKIDDEQDCLIIQSDLNRLSEYYKRNNITVNISKCECITFTRKPKPIIYSYTFDGIPIRRTSLVRDLGVYFDNKMLLREHISKIVDKGYKNLGFVIRTCKPFKNVNTIKTIYFAYVRSVIEYASPIWNPQYAIYIDRLERLQKILIRHLKYRFPKPEAYKTYKESCYQYGLTPLEDRRKVLDLCLLYDIVNGNLDCPELVESVKYNIPSRRSRRRLPPLFVVPKASTNYGRNAPMSRLPQTYNDIFWEIDTFTQSKNMVKHKAMGILNQAK